MATPGVTVGFDNPARQVLNNQELATIIVNFFNAAENPKDDNKKALARLATLNKSFFHASTDVFWKQMPSVSPFLRLLPLFPGEDRVETESAMKTIHSGDAWERFRFYHRKTVQLELSDDKTIGKEMPNHWFFCLLQLPSRPPTLWPKLTELAITSIAGLNSVLPFHIPHNLRHVTIKDFSVNNAYDGLKKIVLTSLLTGFASNERRIQSMAIKSPLTPAMTGSFHQFIALETLSLTFPSPIALEYLSCLNTLPKLKKLTLFSRGSGGIPTVPAEGHHLNQYHPMQGKSSVTDLVVVGDGFFIFWATLFLASSNLLNYHARTPSTHQDPIQGVFMIPHALDIISKRSTDVKRIRFEWDDPADPELIEELDVFTTEPVYRVPQDLWRSFSKLKNIAFLDIRNVPFVMPDFSVKILNHISDMKQLSLLRLLQRPATSRPEDVLVLPTLGVLRDLATHNPALNYVSIACDLRTMPGPPVDSPPKHKLKTLFVTPRGRSPKLEVGDVIAISTFIDGLFNDLVDIKSWFEVGKGGDAVVPGTNLKPLVLWKDVEPMIRHYQGMRKSYKQ